MGNLFKKVFEFISTSGHSRTISIIVVLIIAAAIPLTVVISQQQQETRQHAANTIPPTQGTHIAAIPLSVSDPTCVTGSFPWGSKGVQTTFSWTRGTGSPIDAQWLDLSTNSNQSSRDNGNYLPANKPPYRSDVIYVSKVGNPIGPLKPGTAHWWRIRTNFSGNVWKPSPWINFSTKSCGDPTSTPTRTPTSIPTRTPTPAQTLTPATNLHIFYQGCVTGSFPWGSKGVETTFSWTRGTGSSINSQYLDLSTNSNQTNRDNNRDYTGANNPPYSTDIGYVSKVGQPIIGPLKPGTPHWWRINTNFSGNVWKPSPWASFSTISCSGPTPTRTPTPTIGGPTLTPTPTPTTTSTRPPPCYFDASGQQRGYGDINGDGQVSNVDAGLVLTPGLTAVQKKAGDVNGDGVVDFPGDGQMIAWYAAGVISTFPICATLTPTPTPTIGSPTSTPTPTIGSPTLTPTLTPTIPAGNTVFAATIGLDAIGTTGDNTTPSDSSGSNKNPKRPTRNIKVEVSDGGGNPVANKSGTIIYSAERGKFTGSIDMGTLASGNYNLKVKSDGYLKRLIPGIQTITLGQTYNVPPVNLVTGDINNDNAINILDSSILISCSIFSTDNQDLCNSNAQYSVLSDLEDNGVIDQLDYNLFLRELSVQNVD